MTVISMITLDGILQGPGNPTEDTSGGFNYCGWVAPYSDEMCDKYMEKLLKPADYLLGRVTFEIWENYWPEHSEMWPGINTGIKYVMSETRNETEWENTVFINDLETIKKLKNSEGANIQIWGSGKLIQLLLKHDLVDELWLIIHPLILGEGKKLFEDGVMPATFELKESVPTPSGVIVANYLRAGKVKTGTVGNEMSVS